MICYNFEMTKKCIFCFYKITNYMIKSVTIRRLGRFEYFILYSLPTKKYKNSISNSL